MARCGRCGLYNKYPSDHPETKWAGVCLWYQKRIVPTTEYEAIDCADFLERVPQLTPIQHFDYKVKRDNLGDAYAIAKRSKVIAIVSLTLSIAGILLKVFM